MDKWTAAPPSQVSDPEGSATPKLETRLRVLILQHPQEPDHELGTANLTARTLAKAEVRVGLSWPNLAKALGAEATANRWAVLYLGSGLRTTASASGITLVDKTGAPLAPPAPALDGLIVLDGTWSQAKALWWRNAWLLKARRAILTPSGPSLYGELRREPRRECLSTIESVAEALVALGEEPAVGEKLRAEFAAMLTTIRASGKRLVPPSGAAAGGKRRGPPPWRRKRTRR